MKNKYKQNKLINIIFPLILDKKSLSNKFSISNQLYYQNVVAQVLHHNYVIIQGCLDAISLFQILLTHSFLLELGKILHPYSKVTA